jgi:hypothetical protein
MSDTVTEHIGSRPTAPGRRSRPWWLVLGSALTVLLLVWSALQVVSLLARSTREVRVTEPATGLAEVVVELSGGSLLVRGASGEQLRLDGRVVSDVSEATLDVARDGDRWVVQVRCRLAFLPTACGADLELAVPAGLAVTVLASNAPVRLVGLAGALDVRTSNDRVEGDALSGPVRVRTSNDRVELRGLRSRSVDVTTSNDSVLVDLADVADEVTVQTSNAPVEVVVPDDSGPFAVDLTTSNGSSTNDVRSDPDSPLRITVRTSNDDVVVRHAG